MRSVTNEVRVGVVLILGVVLIVVGTIWLQGWRLGREDQEITAWFREVGQIQRGNPVKLRGVNIGRVEGISLDPAGAGVAVTMSIGSDVRLPEDPVVLLSMESLFGDWQAEIHSRSRYPFYDYAVASDPSVIPGYSLPDMSRLTAVGDRIAENLAVITDRVDLAFTDETALNIREAIDNIQRVTGQLTGLVEAQEQTVRDVAAGLESTTQTLQRAAESASRAFMLIEAAIDGGELESIVGNVERLTAQMDTLSRALVLISGDVGGAAAAADSAFSTLHEFVAGIERGEGSLGLLLQDTTLYRDLVLTSSLVQELIRDFQRNPRRYINLRVF
jgi:phospholipid/cholesterol/gamma-HCH transport system substrate-binding protein